MEILNQPMVVMTGYVPHTAMAKAIGQALAYGLALEQYYYYEKKGYGMKYASPISKICIHLVNFAFVDDTDLIQDGIDMIDMMGKAQEALNLWEEVLCYGLCN